MKLIPGFAAIKPTELEQRSTLIITETEPTKGVGVCVQEVEVSSEMKILEGTKVIYDPSKVLVVVDGIHYMDAYNIIAEL